MGRNEAEKLERWYIKDKEGEMKRKKGRNS